MASARAPRAARKRPARFDQISQQHGPSRAGTRGHPGRRAVCEQLADRPQAVGELASGLPVSRPAVSQHLKVLKAAGLLVDRPVGTRRVYQLDPGGVGALRAQLERMWNNALATCKEVAEAATEEVP